MIKVLDYNGRADLHALLRIRHVAEEERQALEVRKRVRDVAETLVRDARVSQVELCGVGSWDWWGECGSWGGRDR